MDEPLDLSEDEIRQMVAGLSVLVLQYHQGRGMETEKNTAYTSACEDLFSQARASGVSASAFDRLFFSVCYVNNIARVARDVYTSADTAKSRMSPDDKVAYVAENTLTFSQEVLDESVKQMRRSHPTFFNCNH